MQCTVTLSFDDKGVPTNVHVTRAWGMGLDEKAIDALQKWRFRPGTRDGKPVPVTLVVEISFSLR